MHTVAGQIVSVPVSHVPSDSTGQCLLSSNFSLDKIQGGIHLWLAQSASTVGLVTTGLWGTGAACTKTFLGIHVDRTEIRWHEPSITWRQLPNEDHSIYMAVTTILPFGFPKA